VISNFTIIICGSTANGAGRNGSVGIATRYGKDGPGIEYRIPVGGDTFCTTSDMPWGPPSFLCNGAHGFARGAALTAHPYLAPKLQKEYSYTSTPLLCLHGRFRVTFTVYCDWHCSTEHMERSEMGGESGDRGRVLVGKPTGKRVLRRARCRWYDNIEAYIEEMCWQVVDCIIWLRIRSGEESCEQRYSLSDFVKWGKFIHSPRMWLLISLGLLTLELVVTVTVATVALG